MDALAPIALFAYRRPVHLARTLKSLLSNPESHETVLYAFSDAPKDVNSRAEVDAVEAVRRILRDIEGLAAVQLVFRESNYGLSGNITDGVSHVLARHEQVIVLEDDLELSQFFLRFMNDALARYCDEPRVGNITGYCYPTSVPLPPAFLVRGPQSWSWATGGDRWQQYNPDGRELRRELARRGAEREFDFGGWMRFTEMLEKQIAGKNDSWAIRWYAACFLQGWLTLYPGRSLVRNIGREGSGTHGGDPDDIYKVTLADGPIPLDDIAVAESRIGREAFTGFFRGYTKAGSIWRRVARRSRMLGKAVGIRWAH